MKRMISLTLASVLCLSLFAGCGSKEAPEASTAPEATKAPVESVAPEATKAPEAAPAPEASADLSKVYTDAIIAARDAEYNEAFPVIFDTSDELSGLIFEMLGLTEADMSAFALSVSPMNTHAYGVAVVMPAEGHAEAVEAGLKGFVELQQQNFETYLADQYDIAMKARLETLEDGTVVMVMCEDQDTIFDSIVAGIQG